MPLNQVNKKKKNRFSNFHTLKPAACDLILFWLGRTTAVSLTFGYFHVTFKLRGWGV